jgi:hypothetical protein
MIVKKITNGFSFKFEGSDNEALKQFVKAKILEIKAFAKVCHVSAL